MLLVIVIPASAVNSLSVTTVSPVNGQTVSGSITWQAVVGSANVGRVDFAIDGTVKWSEHVAPWLYNGVPRGLKTTALSNGAHTLTAKAYSKNGKSTGTSTVTITVSNAASAPRPPLSPTLMPPTSTTLPTISGTTTVGQTLSTSTGTWSGSTPMSDAYSWLRCNSTGGSCSPISGASSAGYLLGSGDAGSTIRVSVTATNAAGSATASSAATALVASAPSALSSPTLGTALPSRMPASSGTVTTVSSMSALSSAIGTASAGAVIEVRGGSYGGTLAINSKRLTAAQIAASGPITITNYPGETVTFTGPSSQTMGGLFLIDNSQGIRLKGSGGGFIIDAPYMGVGVKIDTSQHIEIDGLVLRNIGTSGIGGSPILVASNSGNALTYSDDVQIWNNTITNWATDGAGHQHGIYYGSRGDQSTGTRSGAENGVIANNLIYDGQGGYGIQLGDQARHTIVTNNTIVHMDESAYGVGSGIVSWSSGGTYGSQSNVLINNILSNNVAFAVQASGSSASPTTVRDNLAYANALAPPDYQTNGYTNLSIGTNLPDANPLYVNYTGKDFHLQAGSPALGKADPAYTPPFDKDGKARPGTPALGAFG